MRNFRFELQWFDRHIPRDTEHVAERQEPLKAAGVEVSPAPVEEIIPQVVGRSVTISAPLKREVNRVKYVCGR